MHSTIGYLSNSEAVKIAFRAMFCLYSLLTSQISKILVVQAASADMQGHWQALYKALYCTSRIGNFFLQESCTFPFQSLTNFKTRKPKEVSFYFWPLYLLYSKTSVEKNASGCNLTSGSAQSLIHSSVCQLPIIVLTCILTSSLIVFGSFGHDSL